MGCVNPYNNIEVTSIASPPNDNKRLEVVFSFRYSSRIKVHCAATLALLVLVTHPCDEKRYPTACFWGRDCWVHLRTGGEVRFIHFNFDLIKIMLVRNQEDWWTYWWRRYQKETRRRRTKLFQKKVRGEI